MNLVTQKWEFFVLFCNFFVHLKLSQNTVKNISCLVSSYLRPAECQGQRQTYGAEVHFLWCNGDQKPIMRKQGWGTRITRCLKLKIITVTQSYSINKATYPRHQKVADAVKQTTRKNPVGFLWISNIPNIWEHLLSAHYVPDTPLKRTVLHGY